MKLFNSFLSQFVVVFGKLMKRFGEKLRTLREREGLSQRKLGAMLEMHQSYLWRLEQGQKMPNVAMILKVADTFGLSTDQLIRDELEV